MILDRIGRKMNRNVCGGCALSMAVGIASPDEDEDGAGCARGKVGVRV
jgi:hypothetical protein